MRNWKIKLTGTLMTLGLLVSLVSLMAVPAMAVGGNVVYFTPDPAEAPVCGQEVEVILVAQIDTDNAAVAADITFTFDNTCLEITDVADNTADWQGGIYYSDLPYVNAAGEMHIAAAVGKNPAIAGAIPVVTLWIRCIECSPACAASALDLTFGEYTTAGMQPIEADLDDGEFSCGVGKELDSYTAGAVQKDEFLPGEEVYAYGQGFLPGMDYQIYIEPYVPGAEVNEGQPLDPTGGAPLGYMPIIVPANPDGTIGPVYLFTAAEEHICMYWEIVADNMMGLAGIYNEAEDGLDAVALEDYGFHVVPEVLTIILVGGGLVGLGGYVVARRRKSANREA